MHRGMIALQGDASGGLQRPSGENTMRGRRDDRHLGIGNAGKVYIGVRRAGRESGLACQLGKRVSL